MNLSEFLDTITRSHDFWYEDEKLMDNIEKLKRDTYYTVLYRLENLSGNLESYDGNEVGIGSVTYEKNLPDDDIQSELDKNGGWCKIKFQLTNDFITQYSSYKQLHIRPIRRSTAPVEGESIEYTIRGFAILEGDYITNPIPFNKVFEGMQSVKMPVLSTIGKNLFDGKFTKYEGVYGYYYLNNGTYTCSITDNDTSVDVSNLSFGVRDTGIVWFFDEGTMYNTKKTITNGKLIFYPNTEEAFNKIKQRYQIQVEEGTGATPYEPYKSNILSTSEDIELRGIDEVRDELNVLTGEKIERISKIVLDGSEETWDNNYETTNTMTFRLPLPNKYFYIDQWDNTGLKNDCGFEQVGWFYIYNDKVDKECYGVGDNNNIYIRILKSRLNSVDVNGFKSFLSTNPITIQYELATESIKTVDLTTVDQDGQPTQLGTFENVTHVSLESAGLIPEVEMEVATNLLEDTVFNLTNSFTTLYPTAAKPVVDGTLYGQTLVNLATQKSGRFNGTRFLRIPLSYTLKSNTNYFVNFIVKESTLTDGVTCRFKNTSTGITLGALKSSGIIAVNTNVPDILEIYIDNTDYVTNGLDAIIDDIMVIEYQDGMENWDIPYFTGMQSVQAPGMTMTGKNLINRQTMNGGYIDASGIFQSNNTDLVSEFIRVFPNTNYTYKVFTNKIYDMRFTFFDKNKSMIERTDSFRISNGRHKTYRSPSNAYYVRVHSNNFDIIGFDADISLVMGDTPLSSYEPYKSITLSTPSDLELRKVGEVQDEVNVMTGEVVERIGEMVFDGSEDWKLHPTNGYFWLTSRKKLNAVNDKLISDKLISNGGNSNFPQIKFFNGIDTVDKFKAWLQENKPTMQFKLEVESIKTVDLTITNQDGNETKLRTFDDMTHVLLNSEGIPMSKASLTVRTKIPSGSSTSLLMDDISTKQEQLNTTVDEQSNNVDATMIATTEIYEETL